jgi:hypothetical protein
VEYKSGEFAPHTIDGTNRFENCPKAADFRRQKRGA